MGQRLLQLFPRVSRDVVVTRQNVNALLSIDILEEDAQSRISARRRSKPHISMPATALRRGHGKCFNQRLRNPASSTLFSYTRSTSNPANACRIHLKAFNEHVGRSSARGPDGLFRVWDLGVETGDSLMRDVEQLSPSSRCDLLVSGSTCW